MDGEGPLQDLVEGGKKDSEGQQIPAMEIKACGSRVRAGVMAPNPSLRWEHMLFLG